MQWVTRNWHALAAIGISALALVAAIFGHAWQEARAIRVFTEHVQADPAMERQIIAYNALLRAIGADRAQDVLVEALPTTSWSHMIDHETGKFLYETMGAAGIGQCKSYLTGACFHGFILAMVADRGLASLPTILNECQSQTEEGKWPNCYHGLGHAFLVQAGYENLPKAFALCKETFGDDASKANYCYDGIAMENGLGFDVPPPNRWYKVDDPMYPCNIPDVVSLGAHDACWFMQSQATLHSVYAFLGADVKKVGAYCETLPAKDAATCLDGLAKQITWRSGNDLTKIRSACGALAPAQAAACVRTGIITAYGFSAYADKITILKACMADPDTNACYESLFLAIASSAPEKRERVAACAQLPEESYRVACVAWMDTPAAAAVADITDPN